MPHIQQPHLLPFHAHHAIIRRGKQGHHLRRRQLRLLMYCACQLCGGRMHNGDIDYSVMCVLVKMQPILPIILPAGIHGNSRADHSDQGR